MTADAEVTRTSLRRTVGFLVVLALTIMLPAWSWRYWQGWLYWAVFSAATMLTGFYFIRHDPKLAARRLRAGPAAESRKSQKVIQTFTSVFMALTFLIPGFDRHFGWSAVPPLWSIGGDVAVAVSYWIVFRTFKANSYAAATVVVESQQTVATTGPYAWVRHPMYSGAIVMLLATPIALGSLWGLIFAAAACAAIVWRLLDEEDFLRANLPGYAEYCRTTRSRLVPGIW
jgi:protein-S-isoprenylcysteine O-methyltransferase Ste14